MSAFYEKLVHTASWWTTRACGSALPAATQCQPDRRNRQQQSPTTIAAGAAAPLPQNNVNRILPYRRHT
jgi:hypothetical protein